MKTPEIAIPFYCEPCTFEDVLPIWRDELWPHRKSPIEAMSAMNWLGGYSQKTGPASYWRIAVQTTPTGNLKTVAVASGHISGQIDGSIIGLAGEVRAYRVRGIWVHPDFRRRGMAYALMRTAIKQACNEKCKAVWIYPRRSSTSLYESMGFKRVGDWITNEDALAPDIGANCFAIKGANELLST